MRISDWSSDVCSSDLQLRADLVFVVIVNRDQCVADAEVGQQIGGGAGVLGADRRHTLQDVLRARRQIAKIADRRGDHVQVPGGNLDRKSVVQGKSVSVRVDLGGRGIIKKKKKI